MLHAEIIDRIGAGNRFDVEWDELCLCSYNGTAGARTEILVELQRQFFAASQLMAIAIRDHGGRLVAGLPLIARRSAGVFTSLHTVSNHWWPSSQLVIDSPSNLLAAVEAIVESLGKLYSNSIWLDWVPIDQPEWLAIAETLRQRGCAVVTKKRFEVGVTRLCSSWEKFEQELSRNTRKRARSQWKRMQQAGKVEFEAFSETCPYQTNLALQHALEIDARSWKGKQQSSIGCCPKAKAFYGLAAERLSQVGRLRIFFLKLDGKPIAFDFGEFNRNTYRSIKVSFDQQLAELSPGHVLNQWLMRYLSECPVTFSDSQQDGDVITVDTVGPINQAIASWSNQRYSVGRLVVASGSWLKNAPGRSLVSLLNVKSAWSGSTSTTAGCD